MTKPYQISFPPENTLELSQSETRFTLIEDGDPKLFRFHDYDAIYRRPGLYEQIFYERLKCASPAKVAEILRHAVESSGEAMSELRVLDFGAGNGIMGEELKDIGVARLVGMDIIPEARDAAWRDRPAVYDDYIVADILDLDAESETTLESWSFDCLTSVAALGFGDVAAPAFLKALRYVAEGGWIAFNIKVTFLDESDATGFSKLIRDLLFSDYIDIHHLERYRHRLSMEGLPLFYFAMVARKKAHVPEGFLARV